MSDITNYTLSKNVKIDYEIIYTGDLDAALNSSDYYIASCVDDLASDEDIIIDVSFGGTDTLNKEANCTILEATEAEEACAPVAGSVLAKFVPTKIDFYGAEARVFRSVSECMDSFIAEDENIVDIELVGRNINIGRIGVLEDYETPSDGSGLSPGGIAGLSILGLAVVAGIALLAARHRRKKNDKSGVKVQQNPENADEFEVAL